MVRSRADPQIGDRDAGVERGVTTVVDAGSSGASNFESFREMARRSVTRVLGYLNVSAQPGSPIHGDWSRFDQLRTIETAEANRDLILGSKVLASQRHSGNLGIIPLQLGIQAAREARTGLMVHIGVAPPLIQEVLNMLGPGDVITHCLKGYPGGIMNRAGRPVPEAWAAAERGVFFDVAHGQGSFAFPAARQALAAGFPVHSISTDLHQGNLGGPVYTLGHTMAKFMHLGLSLPEVVKLVTLGPARIIGREDEFGTLRPGSCADITLFRLREGTVAFTDSEARTEQGFADLEAVFTIRAGRDLGTTWCKAALYDPQGAVIASHRVSSRGGAAGIGASDAVALSTRAYNGVWLDGAMGAVPVDEAIPNQHDPLVYQSEGWGEGGPWAAAYAPIVVANLRWLRAERPAFHARVRRAGGLHDYLLWRFTGRWATDPCNGPGAALRWPDAAVTLSGLPPSAFSEPLPFDARVGALTGAAAADLGLPSGLPVACGGHDGALANLGGGAWEAGTALITLGTNAVVRIAVPEPIAGAFGYPLPGGAWAWVRGAHGTAALVEAAGAPGSEQHEAALSVVAAWVQELAAAAGEKGLHPMGYQLTGGLTHEPRLLRRLEEALGVPLVQTDPEAGCRGAAILASVVAGWYSGVAAAAYTMRFPPLTGAGPASQSP